MENQLQPTNKTETALTHTANNSTEFCEKINRHEISSNTTLVEYLKKAEGVQQLSSLVHKYENGEVDRYEAWKVIKIQTQMMLQYFGTLWQDYQVDVFAKDFFREYYFFTDVDMQLFSQRVRTMQYGKIYKEGLSPAKLMEFAAMYAEERMNASGQISEIKHQQIKNAEAGKYAHHNERRDKEAARVEYIMQRNERDANKQKVIDGKQRVIEAQQKRIDELEIEEQKPCTNSTPPPKEKPC